MIKFALHDVGFTITITSYGEALVIVKWEKWLKGKLRETKNNMGTKMILRFARKIFLYSDITPDAMRYDLTEALSVYALFSHHLTKYISIPHKQWQLQVIYKINGSCWFFL